MINDNFIGEWVTFYEFDSDDFRTRYTISFEKEELKISAEDVEDGEIFEITDINMIDENTVTFKSFMPSTGRKGLNKFVIVGEKEIEFSFTFTSIEPMKKIN